MGMALNRNRLAILFMATIFLLGGCTKPSERRENRELIAYVDSAYNVTGKDSVRNGLLVVQSYIDHVKGGPVDLEALSRMMGAIDSDGIPALLSGLLLKGVERVVTIGLSAVPECLPGGCTATHGYLLCDGSGS